MILDARLERSTNLVAAVDELVSSLPAPQDEMSVKSKVKDVVEFSRNVRTDMDIVSMTNMLQDSMNIREARGALAEEMKGAWFRTCLKQIEKAAEPPLL